MIFIKCYDQLWNVFYRNQCRTQHRTQENHSIMIWSKFGVWVKTGENQQGAESPQTLENTGFSEHSILDEMGFSWDEARHGKGFEGMLKRYFK